MLALLKIITLMIAGFFILCYAIFLSLIALVFLKYYFVKFVKSFFSRCKYLVNNYFVVTKQHK